VVQPPVAGLDATLTPPASSDVKMVLAIGRLAIQKRHDRLIEAFKLAARDRPDWRLVILGEGPERERLERMAGPLVSLPGAVGDVAAWLDRADLFAMASEFEGFPNALGEAMACGAPPVAMDCPYGVAELIRPGVDGWLTPPGDVRALADALALAMDDPQRRRDYAVRAREVTTRFSLDAVMLRWTEILTEAVERVQRTRTAALVKGKTPGPVPAQGALTAPESQ